jgi:hypothetical protein
MSSYVLINMKVFRAEKVSIRVVGTVESRCSLNGSICLLVSVIKSPVGRVNEYTPEFDCASSSGIAIWKNSLSPRIRTDGLIWRTLVADDKQGRFE